MGLFRRKSTPIPKIRHSDSYTVFQYNSNLRLLNSKSKPKISLQRKSKCLALDEALRREANGLTRDKSEHTITEPKLEPLMLPNSNFSVESHYEFDDYIPGQKGSKKESLKPFLLDRFPSPPAIFKDSITTITSRSSDSDTDTDMDMDIGKSPSSLLRPIWKNKKFKYNLIAVKNESKPISIASSKTEIGFELQLQDENHNQNVDTSSGSDAENNNDSNDAKDYEEMFDCMLRPFSQESMLWVKMMKESARKLNSKSKNVVVLNSQNIIGSKLQFVPVKTESKKGVRVGLSPEANDNNNNNNKNSITKTETNADAYPEEIKLEPYISIIPSPTPTQESNCNCPSKLKNQPDNATVTAKLKFSWRRVFRSVLYACSMPLHPRNFELPLKISKRHFN